MKCLIVLLYFFITVLIKESLCSERAVWVAGESGVHPDHPGKCWSSSLKREFKVGEEFSDSTKCEQIRCGANLRFAQRVCSNRRPQAGCIRTKPDSLKNYPDCCGKIQCAPVKIDY